MGVRLFKVIDQDLKLYLLNFSSISLVLRMRITQFEDLIMRCLLVTLGSFSSEKYVCKKQKNIHTFLSSCRFTVGYGGSPHKPLQAAQLECTEQESEKQEVSSPRRPLSRSSVSPLPLHEPLPLSTVCRPRVLALTQPDQKLLIWVPGS